MLKKIFIGIICIGAIIAGVIIFIRPNDTQYVAPSASNVVANTSNGNTDTARPGLVDVANELQGMLTTPYPSTINPVEYGLDGSVSYTKLTENTACLSSGNQHVDISDQKITLSDVDLRSGPCVR